MKRIISALKVGGVVTNHDSLEEPKPDGISYSTNSMYPLQIYKRNNVAMADNPSCDRLHCSITQNPFLGGTPRIQRCWRHGFEQSFFL